MKIISRADIYHSLKQRFQKYDYLDVTLVEKGIDYEGLAFIFDYQHLEDVEDYLQSLDSSQMIYGKKKERIYKIDIHRIIYIEGFSKEAYVHTQYEQYEVKERLYELTEILAPYGFVRINKSMIINCYMIESIEPLINMRYRIYLKNDHYVELTRSYVKAFKNYLKMR